MFIDVKFIVGSSDQFDMHYNYDNVNQSDAHDILTQGTPCSTVLEFSHFKAP